MLKGQITSFGDFSKIRVGERLASGGAGTIYKLDSHPDFVFKKYHPSVNLSYYQEKIEAMLEEMPSLLSGQNMEENSPELTWPVSSISEKNKFVGYIMPALDSKNCVTLSKFINKKSREVFGLSQFMGYRFNIAFNLASIVSKIHASNFLIVDLKPQNCFVNNNNMFVTIIDNDGFFIKSSSGKEFAARQFTPEYIAPELCSKTPIEANIMQDNFALAVIIFRLINNGIHPFQASLKTKQLTIQEMVTKKKYAYSLEGPKNLIPSQYSIHNYLPEDLRSLFDQAFTQKHRPSAESWKKAIHKYTSLDQGFAEICEKNKSHLKLMGICGSCQVEESLNKLNTQISSINSSRINKQNNIQKISQKGTLNLNRIFKVELIKQSVKYALITHFLGSIFIFYYLSVDFSILDYLQIKIQKYISTFIYIFILFVFFYRAFRGKPERDCPSCGAHAGSLKFQDNQTSFAKYLHQTKAGRPDKRYNYNPELFSQVSNWKCVYCDAIVEFVHELAINQTLKTAIIHKRVI